MYLSAKQRCRDEVMKYFLFWCRHLLVPFLFHDMTSLHPFSTCKLTPTSLQFGTQGFYCVIIKKTTTGTGLSVDFFTKHLHCRRSGHHVIVILPRITSLRGGSWGTSTVVSCPDLQTPPTMERGWVRSLINFLGFCVANLSFQKTISGT